MRITRTWTISLPPQMSVQAATLAKTEQRTKSELVREALRLYFITRGKPLAMGSGERLARLEELTDIYRQRYGAQIPTEAELRKEFRGFRQLHDRLKHLGT